MPKITSLDVTCEKNLMKVFVEFDKPFYGIIFSKGHYSDVNCVHLPAGLGRTSAKFDVSINSCGTTGNTENGLYGYGADSGSGTFFENTIVVQYDPQVQEVWDQARKLRCTWHDQYEKSVTFRYVICKEKNNSTTPITKQGNNVISSTTGRSPSTCSTSSEPTLQETTSDAGCRFR